LFINKSTGRCTKMPMVKFMPTDEQREQVALMAAGRFSQEEIACVIINPRTGRPINAKTLARIFKKELHDTAFKKEIIEAFQEQVRAKNWRAIQYGMDHIVGFATGAATATATTNISIGNGAEDGGIRVSFVASPQGHPPRDTRSVMFVPFML
jgi:hypothetical protein